MTHEGFLTIGYCFAIVFWKFLWGGGQGLDGGVMGDPPSPLLGKTQICHYYISVGAELVVLKSEWSRAGLCIDLPVIVCSHTKTGYQVHEVLLIWMLWKQAWVYSADGLLGFPGTFFLSFAIYDSFPRIFLLEKVWMHPLVKNCLQCCWVLLQYL